MDWNLTSILILLAVLFSGYGIGLLEMHLRRQKKIGQLEAALKDRQNEREVAPAAEPAVPGLLRLWTDADQSLRLDLDGASLTSPATTTPEQRRRLITLLTSMRPWAEGGPAAPVSKTDSVSPLKPVAAVAGSSRGIDLPPPIPVAKSIVAQIDEVLQERLNGTPLAGKRIRLSETPGGDVLVFIGTARYEGLDVVPDKEAVAAIRAAIAEWENKVK